MRLGRAGPSRADAGTGPRPLRDAPQPRRWLLAAGTRALEPLPQQLRNTGARLRAVLSRAGRVVIPGCPQQRRTSHWGALFWGKKKKKKTDLKKIIYFPGGTRAGWSCAPRHIRAPLSVAVLRGHCGRVPNGCNGRCRARSPCRPPRPARQRSPRSACSVRDHCVVRCPCSKQRA